jgi:hypothetical protein
MLALLCKILPYKEIGWKELGEVFYRFTLLKTPWGNLYLHRLDAPCWHPACHDHPWSFLTILLWNGYLERVGDQDEYKVYKRRPGSILYRPAEFSHSIITPYGTSWSLVFTTKKVRDWGFKSCQA